MFIITLFSLFLAIDARIYPRCYHFKTLDSCIYNDFCQWCNTSDVSINRTNITEYKCIPNSNCFENSNCIRKHRYNNMCITLNIFLNFVLIFILIYSVLYISTISSLIINKYTNDNKNDGIITRSADKRFLIILINLLLFGPLLIFWLLGKLMFVYYFIFIMILVIFVSTASQLKKKSINKSGYTSIN